MSAFENGTLSQMEMANELGRRRVQTWAIIAINENPVSPNQVTRCTLQAGENIFWVALYEDNESVPVPRRHPKIDYTLQKQNQNLDTWEDASAPAATFQFENNRVCVIFNFITPGTYQIKLGMSTVVVTVQPLLLPPDSAHTTESRGNMGASG